MRRSLGLLAAAVLVLACLCIPAATVAWLKIGWRPDSPTPTATIPPVPTEEPIAGPGTARALANAVVPPRDCRALAQRLRPSAGMIPAIVDPEPPRHAVGDKARFWVSNSDSLEMFQVTATLRLLSAHTEMWVEDGTRVDEKGLEEAARSFDERIYPTIHGYFGSEWNPGVDSNPRVAVLNARFDGAAGYFSSHDEFSRLVNPYSNEREMFYINVDAASPGTERYLGILAHEFQHMVHWRLDSNEDSWVNEGASELATRLSDCGASDAVGSFAQRPDTQLNAWSMSPDDNPLPHYGASYLWLEYFLQRLGSPALKALLAEPGDGIEGFKKVLGAVQGAPSFDDFYADWVVASLLDDTSLGDGRYGLEAADPRMKMESTYRGAVDEKSQTVSQYGTDYIAITPRSGAVRIEFQGSPKVAVVPNTPFQGRYEWWSNRGDMSNTTLTRAFDLRGLTKATLHYALWYALEDGWDYAYVEVSTDGGTSWKILSPAHTSDYNPNGNAFGPGYTGFSGYPAASKTLLTPVWVQDTVDLTPYAGQQILVRFEMITDDAVNLPGMCLDNISVPELWFDDDAEGDAAGWQAEGFVRMDNELPQSFLVQIIEQGREVRIQRLRLDEGQRGTLTVEGFGEDLERAVLAISGLTLYTTEPARYSYRITPLDEGP